MKKVEAYKTNDGHFFEHKWEAEKHELITEFIKIVEPYFENLKPGTAPLRERLTELCEDMCLKGTNVNALVKLIVR